MGDYMSIINADGEESLFETNITTFFADTMFKYNGWAFMGEFAHRDAKNAQAMNGDGAFAIDEDGNNIIVREGIAVNTQLSYLFKNNYEITGRFTKTDYTSVTKKEEQEQYTLGLSRYVVGHKLKVQSDISYNTSTGTNRGIEFRIGFDLHF